MFTAIATTGVASTSQADGNVDVITLTHHIQRFEYVVNKLL